MGDSCQRHTASSARLDVQPERSEAHRRYGQTGSSELFPHLKIQIALECAGGLEILPAPDLQAKLKPAFSDPYELNLRRRRVRQAEAEPDAKGTDEHVQQCEINPGGLQNNERAKADDTVARDGSERFAEAHVDTASSQHMICEPLRGPPRDPDEGHEQRDDDEQLQRGDLAASDSDVEKRANSIESGHVAPSRGS